jgi:hypothetical protein
VFARQAQALAAVLGLQHGVALVGEDIRDKLSDSRIVFDDQDRACFDNHPGLLGDSGGAR